MACFFKAGSDALESLATILEQVGAFRIAGQIRERHLKSRGRISECHAEQRATCRSS